MSDPIATYSFLPWLRQGLANNITQEDPVNNIVQENKDSSVKLRASIPIKLTVSATKIDGSAAPDQSIDETVELYGPGDIIGIDSKAIVRTEPRNWITNFEPNYLPYIEFYEEDFPWRYTPFRPGGERLRPWLTLVVLKEEEFEDKHDVNNKPLPSFKLKDGASTAMAFPEPSELWAWAHVHVNTDLSENERPVGVDTNKVTTALASLIEKTPDQAYSRLVCPRKLETNMGYHAFLIPSFESGRCAGLGIPLPPKLMETGCAWDDPATVEFPYYHRWYFKTGNVGDFEYLVNLLKPKPADKSVGVRDMDVLHPGANLPAIDNPQLNGILKLGGALRVPVDSLKDEDKAERIKFDEWDENPYPHPFVTAIGKRINLADDYVDKTKDIKLVNEEIGILLNDNTGDPDPVITSPLYGRWHALQERLLEDRSGTALPHNKNWIHELNLDPRFRVSAGLGTKVVKKNQEDYMQAAWEQVGEVVEANNKMRMAQLAMQVSNRFYINHFVPLLTERAFVLAAPVQKRIVYQGLTIHKQLEDSVVPSAITSGAFRSITRARGRTMKKLGLTAEANGNNLIERINEGEVIVVPDKVDPEGAINLADIAKDVKPKVPGFLENLFKRYRWFKYLPLILLILLLLILAIFSPRSFSSGIVAAIAIAMIWLFRKFNSWGEETTLADTILQEHQTPEAVDHYPLSPDFVISSPTSGFVATKGNTDSEEAVNFKIALKEVFALVNISFPEPERAKLNLAEITQHIIQSLNPVLTISKRTFGTLNIPLRILDNMVEKFRPVMVHPEIDLPMYKPLADMSSELFLPNINLIEQNSITLLENNQKFIEAYMVGINHEMSRELLWREYPTDQRGTYFRQFWDVSSTLSLQPESENTKEALRDIPPIHRWHKTSSGVQPKRNELGQHNQRALASGKTQLVLVVRGELLKKYPTAVVYAQKADWGADMTEERQLVKLDDTMDAAALSNYIKTPLFEAKVEPDIYFFGFDLDDEEAQGTINPSNKNDDPGWFFVIKERPGEPRFGLDIEKSSNELGEEKIINWNNLSWKDVGTSEGSCISLKKDIAFSPYKDADQENRPNEDDQQAKWGQSTNAAQLAYILYQVPVLVGVHASRMLPQ